MALAPRRRLASCLCARCGRQCHRDVAAAVAALLPGRVHRSLGEGSRCRERALPFSRPWPVHSAPGAPRTCFLSSGPAPDAHPFLLTFPRRGLSCSSRPSHGTRSTRAPRCRLQPPARSSSCSCGGRQATPLSTARRPWRLVALISNRWEEVMCDLVLRLHPVLSFRGHSGERRCDLLPSVRSDRTQRGDCGVNDSFALRLRFTGSS